MNSSRLTIGLLMASCLALGACGVASPDAGHQIKMQKDACQHNTCSFVSPGTSAIVSLAH